MSESCKKLEYQKYTLSEEEKLCYHYLSNWKAEAAWDLLEKAFDPNHEMVINGYILYLQEDSFGAKHRVCIPQDLNWMQARTNGGHYVNQDESRIYIIKKDGTLRILDRLECEKESKDRLEIFEQARPGIEHYFTGNGYEVELALFGSVAKGLAKEESDIDVLAVSRMPVGKDLIWFCGELKRRYGYEFHINIRDREFMQSFPANSFG